MWCSSIEPNRADAGLPLLPTSSEAMGFCRRHRLRVLSLVDWLAYAPNQMVDPDHDGGSLAGKDCRPSSFTRS